MNRKKVFSCIFVSALLVGIAGAVQIGGSASAASGASTNAVLKLPGIGSSTTNADGIAIGIKKGFFAKHHITIDNVGNVNIPQYVAAVTSGTISGACLMTADGLTANDNGANLQEVAVEYDAKKNNPHMEFVVLKNSKIKNGKDLAGKKIGVSSKLGCTAGFPLEYARQAGVKDPLSSLQFVVSTEDTLVPAMRQGAVDVVGLHQSLKLVSKIYPDTRVLFTDFNILGDKGGDIAWFFPKNYISAHPDVIKNFVAALGETNNWINNNNAAAQALYYQINPNVNKKVFYLRHNAPDALITPSHTQTWLDILSTGKSVQKLAHKWTLKQVATNKYNANATGSYKF
jgi:ABC-type nitrate/sulfonate/bicarbonate transport systems, periplasmic components